MKNACLKFVALVFSFVFVVVLSISSPVKISAQVPDPIVPCDEVSPNYPLMPVEPGYDPLKTIRLQDEFHSLRPYQASPCQAKLSNEATFCGNELTIKETITETYPGAGTCTNQGGGIIKCDYKINVPLHAITIDLSGANLPFMGNTEEVINSQKKISGTQASSETLSDVDKINDYVSWYLNGTLNRAEYPFLSVEDTSKVVDYSGPINKLLPQDVQFAKRIKTVKQAGDIRHDQIVGCSLNIETPSVLGFIGDIFDIGKIQALDMPIPCYTSGFISAFAKVLNIQKAHRLSQWSGKNLPPLISQYPNYSDYVKALKVWRGNICAKITIPGIIPVIGGQTILLCANNVFDSKFNSYLFNYIPYSSTEDVPGSVAVDSAYPGANNTAIIKEASFSGEAAKLFFPHMEESDQLGSILQDTFAPKGADKVGGATNVTSQVACDTIEVRSNKGDNLFATQITGELGYKADFSCTYNANQTQRSTNNCNTYRGCVPGDYSCAVEYGQADCGGGNMCGSSCSPPVQTCDTDVYINLSTKVAMPLVDDIWSRLVAGPMAIFKRIFPKTNTPGSVGQIIDIAGSTNISYSVSGISGANFKISPTTTNADLKLPHIGGISEYFLKGIQTALRPKGFGEPITFAGNSASCAGGIPTLSIPSSNGSCTLGSDTLPNGSVVPPTLKQIIEAAGTTYNTPPGLIIGIMYGEGLFNSGRYSWTEDNVKNWATCQKVPGCNETGDDNFMGFNGNDFANISPHILADLQQIDPTKTQLSQCNLLDAVYAVAWNLHDSADGGGGMTGTCFGIRLSAPSPGSCSWTNEQYESAIKVAESGYTNMCFTKEGSCRSGGGAGASCPNGDTCETIGRRYTNASHNACVWDVAHSY